MTQLPVAIEQYLMECGFTGTEILILKHLLAGGSMTLRELAAKTGKSTGVLDSASKKLLKKGILGKETVNEIPKLTLSSLEAVVSWVHEDSEHKRASMERREKDLQSFVDSLSTKVSRADIQHFEGIEGMEQAYSKLLEVCGGAMLHFLPVRYTEVDDPLRDFLVQFFRIRRRNGVITRVIAHDTPLGRRYQSRDPFEFRQTLLVPESVYAFNTEKVVAGDWVGTINHAEKKAFLIRSSEMAHTERAMFEALWKQEMVKQKEKGDTSVPVVVPKDEEMKTRVVSAAREFFLSKKSLAVFAGCAVIAGLITFALYKNNEHLNRKRVEEKILSIASTGALQFDPDDLSQLHSANDIKKPQYAKVIKQLNEIRNNNEGVQYIYIMRPTENSQIWEFVADADSLDLSAKKDLNKDGKVDDADHLSPPGERYDDTSSQNNLALIKPVIIGASPDQWGALIAGWAPIKDAKGETIAILGVDKFDSDISKLALTTFKPFIFFLGIFLVLIIARFAALNRSLLKEFLLLASTRSFLLATAWGAIFFIVISGIIYLQTLNLIKEQSAEKLKAIATTAALQIDYKDLETIHFARDMKSDEYQRAFNTLNQIRKENPEIKWAWIMRPSIGKNMWEFVVDADANYFLPATTDDNMDGVSSESEENVYPGFQYDVSKDPIIRSALEGPVAAKKFYSDQWGTYISGFAPILDGEKRTVGIIGLDVTVSNVVNNAKMKFMYIPLLILILVFALLWVNRKLIRRVPN